MAEKNKLSWPGWNTGPCIGKGGFGTVYEISREVFGDVERKALKVIRIPKDEGEVDFLRVGGLDNEGISNTFYNQVGDIIREYKIMSKMLDNPNIVHCDDFKYSRHADGIGWDIYIKMELLTPLMKALDKVKSEEQIIRMGIELCNGLAGCHAANIIHRDIKPQNIFMSPSGIFKLGDFGIARAMEHSTMATPGIGTLNYMAPEVAMGKSYGTSADIYSLGLVLYWMLNEYRGPFVPLPPAVPTYHDYEAARIRRNSGEALPPPKNGSAKLKAIVLKACAFDPNQRFFSASEMMKALRQMQHVSDTNKPFSINKPEDEATIIKGDGNTEKQGTETRNKPISQTVDVVKSMNTKDTYEISRTTLKKILVGVIAACILMTCGAILRKCGKPILERNPPSAGETVAATDNKDQTMPTLDTDKSIESSEITTTHSHVWNDATCILPKTCGVCGDTLGDPLGHRWEEATYTAPMTCSECGATEGEALKGKMPPPDGMIAAGNYHSVYLQADGTVLAVGSDELSKGGNKGTRLDVSEWKDIVAISAASHTVGLKSDGTVVACGVNRFGQCDVSDWTDIIAISAGDNHTVGLRSDGTVVAEGRNDYGQCDVSRWKNIIAIAAANETTFGLKSDGTIVSAGQKNYGYTWKNIADICAGAYDLVGLRIDGTVVSTGSSDGWDNNTLSYWNNIVDISASSSHIVGLKSDGTVVACGLERADEACEVDGWTDIIQVSAGMYFTLGLKADGTVVSVGENAYNQREIG